MAKKSPKTSAPEKEPLWVSLAKDKLESSCLTLEDAVELGMKAYSADDVVKLSSSFDARAALQINYFNIDGSPLVDWPGGVQFYRMRYLQDPKDFSLQAKAIRYTQPPDTIPVAYYPKKLKGTRWVDVAVDHRVEIVITEGELKAASACKAGFPTIGLGGVWNWKSSKLGLTWIPSLDQVNWVRRRIIILFDSDYRRNPSICVSVHELALELERRGAFVFLASLPDLPQLKKTGIDDFLHDEPDAVTKLKQILHEAEPLGLSRPLWKLNDRFIYVANPGMIYDMRTRFKIAPAAFVSHHQSPELFSERTLRSNGTVSFKQVSAASAWLKWPMRREVDALTYAPGKKLYVEDGISRKLNIWPGLAIEPKKGDVTPYLTLIEHLLTGNEEEHKKFFYQWMAYPFQYPGTKLFTAIMLTGIKHGTGKSLAGWTLKFLYGENFITIGSSDLHGSFNAWAEGKQLVLGDEVITRDTKRSDADTLKRIITSPENRINEKFVPAYTIPDCANYFLTSNYPDALQLENDDRRMAIYGIEVGPLDPKFYTDYVKWIRGDGAAALLYYFENEVDVEDFNPAGRAPLTGAKRQMIAHSYTDVGEWISRMLNSPDDVLRLNESPIRKDLFTAKELLILYNPEGRGRLGAVGMGRELARFGVRQVLQGRVVHVSGIGSNRYFAVRNSDIWLNATSSAIIEHLKEYEEKKTRKC